MADMNMYGYQCQNEFKMEYIKYTMMFISFMFCVGIFKQCLCQEGEESDIK